MIQKESGMMGKMEHFKGDLEKRTHKKHDYRAKLNYCSSLALCIEKGRGGKKKRETLWKSVYNGYICKSTMHSSLFSGNWQKLIDVVVRKGRLHIHRNVHPHTHSRWWNSCWWRQWTIEWCWKCLWGTIKRETGEEMQQEVRKGNAWKRGRGNLTVNVCV